MRKVCDVLRLALEARRSQHEIALGLGLAQSTVGEYLRRFRASGLPWPLPPGLDEAMLEARLFARPVVPPAARRLLPSWPTVHRELRRKGVTLQLLWQEYKQGAPDGYQYTQFCRHYRTWAGQLDPVLRQEHKAGERLFVDYAGQTVDVVDPTTGELRAAQLFVGVLGASNYLYAEATWTQTLPDWIAAHVRMLEDFGGATALIVPDNLRTGVTHASFYEPTVNATYQDFAAHYGTAILPTRVARPRDKAKVESGVLLAERWLLAPLRHHTFTSLADLNRAIAQLRTTLNDRPFQKLAGSPRAPFHAAGRPAPPRIRGVPAVPRAAASRRIPRTGPSRTRRTSSGPPPVWCAGARTSARPRARSSSRSSRAGRIPSRATARASGSCPCASAIRTRGSRPRAPARAPPVRSATRP